MSRKWADHIIFSLHLFPSSSPASINTFYKQPTHKTGIGLLFLVHTVMLLLKTWKSDVEFTKTKYIPQHILHQWLLLIHSYSNTCVKSHSPSLNFSLALLFHTPTYSQKMCKQTLPHKQNTHRIFLWEMALKEEMGISLSHSIRHPTFCSQWPWTVYLQWTTLLRFIYSCGHSHMQQYFWWIIFCEGSRFKVCFFGSCYKQF